MYCILKFYNYRKFCCKYDKSKNKSNVYHIDNFIKAITKF